MTTSGWRRVGLLASGVLFLAACTENIDLFSSLDDRSEPELSTLEAGSIMGESDTLNVQIDYPSDDASRATSMQVELRDADGTVHGTVEFDQAELAEPRLPSVEFPEPPEGVYVLVTEAWIHDQLLLSDRRQLFVTSAPPRIESVTIHPTSIRREMQALAVADVDHAASTRPYLRWIFDGGVAREGYLEDGLDRAILDGAGRSAGAYQVSLEVYPWGIDEGAMIDGSTTISAASDVVVREELEPDPPDFIQRGSEHVVRYFSFDGTRQAWTASSADPIEARVEGDVFLDMLSGALGVRASTTGVVSVPIPVSDEPGAVHLVAVRVSTTGSTGGSTGGDEVISFVGADGADGRLPIAVENGTFVAHPSDASPISLETIRDDRELVTLRFHLWNEKGETFLEPATNIAPSGLRISLGSDANEVSLEVRSQANRQVFLDRVTVNDVSDGQLQRDIVDRATRQFLDSFEDGPGQWAFGIPGEWTTPPTIQHDDPEPDDSIPIGVGEVAFLNVLLADKGAVVIRAEDDSTGSVTLRRRGDALELADERSSEQEMSRLDLPDVPEPLSLHRLELRRGTAENGAQTAAAIRVNSDDRGDLVTLLLPERFWNTSATIVAHAAEAEYPVWIGRWTR